LLSRKKYTFSAGVHLFAVTVNLLGAVGVFFTRELIWTAQDAGFGIEMSFRIYNFSQFILLAAAVSILLTGIYSISFMKEKSYSGRFFCLILLTTAMVNGAVLANNPIAMLFFWEGMLCTFFGFLLIKNTEKPETAVKMLTLSGIANMLLMLGIVVTVFLSEAHAIDEIVPIPVEGLGILGYTCLMLGVIGKAGALPFHSWIPDAADDAPLPFLIFSPASLEKLLSIYLLIRVSTDFYTLKPGSAMSISVMTIGALTLVFASAMALIQKDMKKTLAYHTVSQAGYMIKHSMVKGILRPSPLTFFKSVVPILCSIAPAVMNSPLIYTA
jgi:formate hydrogenlyase subunit 3/multisubunit Na+/H+ antiporter MnhD subunit